MTPEQSLDYLNGLGWEMRPGRKFDLATIAAILAELGNPDRAFASVHVAGTNGKGSVCAWVEAAVRAAGYRTGLYTSPHLQRLSERIRIQGDEVAPAALAEAATRVRDAIERLLAQGRLSRPPAFFEVVTAVGFAAFAAAGIELAVIEVGLGGRLDATNVIQPLVAAITPIGMDHEAYLGSTLTAIAAEKAGILKPGLAAVVAAEQPAEVLAELDRHARGAGVKLMPAPAPRRLRALEDGCWGCALAYAGGEIEVELPLRGRHQADNAACAAQVCEQLGRRGFPVSAAALAAGFAGVRWPGRLENIGPPPGLYLDGAHNPLAARALAAFLDAHRATHPAPILIYGSMRDKAVEEICEQLFPRAAGVVLTAPRQPRALTPAALARACGPLARRHAVAEDYPAALGVARQWAAGVAPIFVTGSLYLVGEARDYGCGSGGGDSAA